jgi:hypothetical protein
MIEKDWQGLTPEEAFWHGAKLQRAEADTVIELDKLATALAAAQGAMKNAPRNCVNPFFKSKYADLATVWDTCREALCKNGLSVIHYFVPAEAGTISVGTMLLHSSGQKLDCGALNVRLAKADAQSVGSAITYARRYALAAIAGMAAEDDDGQTASAPATEEPEPPQAVDPKQIDRICNAFRKQGVTLAQLCIRVHAEENEWTEADVEKLRADAATLTKDPSKKDEIFPPIKKAS